MVYRFVGGFALILLGISMAVGGIPPVIVAIPLVIAGGALLYGA